MSGAGDARFEDGGEKPLNLGAQDADDLGVISALVQDAIFQMEEIRYQRGKRRFVVLLNRFRWEDRMAAERSGRTVERVRALLTFDDVLRVSTQGVDRGDGDMVLSLLSIGFEPGTDGSGRVILTLAGDGAIALEVECIEATLRDVTRPYAAPSRKTPHHPE